MGAGNVLGIEDDTVKAIAAKAIMEAIPQAKRDEILKAAISKILTPQETVYTSRGEKHAPLQDIFYQCLYNQAQTMVREKLENDPQVKAQIEKLYSDALAKVFDEAYRTELVNKLAASIAAALSQIKY